MNKLTKIIDNPNQVFQGNKDCTIIIYESRYEIECALINIPETNGKVIDISNILYHKHDIPKNKLKFDEHTIWCTPYSFRCVIKYLNRCHNLLNKRISINEFVNYFKFDNLEKMVYDSFFQVLSKTLEELDLYEFDGSKEQFISWLKIKLSYDEVLDVLEYIQSRIGYYLRDDIYSYIFNKFKQLKIKSGYENIDKELKNILNDILITKIMKENKRNKNSNFVDFFNDVAEIVNICLQESANKRQ